MERENYGVGGVTLITASVLKMRAPGPGRPVVECRRCRCPSAGCRRSRRGRRPSAVLGYWSSPHGVGVACGHRLPGADDAGAAAVERRVTRDLRVAVAAELRQAALRVDADRLRRVERDRGPARRRTAGAVPGGMEQLRLHAVVVLRRHALVPRSRGTAWSRPCPACRRVPGGGREVDVQAGQELVAAGGQSRESWKTLFDANVSSTRVLPCTVHGLPWFGPPLQLPVSQRGHTLVRSREVDVREELDVERCSRRSAGSTVPVKPFGPWVCKSFTTQTGDAAGDQRQRRAERRAVERRRRRSVPLTSQSGSVALSQFVRQASTCTSWMTGKLNDVPVQPLSRSLPAGQHRGEHGVRVPAALAVRGQSRAAGASCSWWLPLRGADELQLVLVRASAWRSSRRQQDGELPGLLACRSSWCRPGLRRCSAPRSRSASSRASPGRAGVPFFCVIVVTSDGVQGGEVRVVAGRPAARTCRLPSAAPSRSQGSPSVHVDLRLALGRVDALEDRVGSPPSALPPRRPRPPDAGAADPRRRAPERGFE